jgi:nucleoside-diphosphate-sugar epimerase
VRIVVTGGTGNVGTAVIEALTKHPSVDDIVCVARRRPPFADSAFADHAPTPHVRWVGLDVSSDPLDVLDGADVVVHLAWQIQPVRDERRLHRVNVAGTVRVVEEAARRGVGRIVVASSVGTYAARAGDGPVDESWPTSGISTSVYSRQKAEVERHLDRLEHDHPDVAIVRMRTSLVFARRAAAEIDRYFLGPLVPTSLIGRGLLPLVPVPADVRFQVVHAADVADAYALAALGDARGAFNVAADPVLGADDLARALDARRVSVPGRILRFGAAATHALHLQRTSPGWVDLGLGVPTMDIERAHRELGWHATRSAHDVLAELIGGFADRAGSDTPPLRPGRNGSCTAFLTSTTTTANTTSTTTPAPND